jgi:hypothetical protein
MFFKSKPLRVLGSMAGRIACAASPTSVTLSRPFGRDHFRSHSPLRLQTSFAPSTASQSRRPAAMTWRGACHRVRRPQVCFLRVPRIKKTWELRLRLLRTLLDAARAMVDTYLSAVMVRKHELEIRGTGRA